MKVDENLTDGNNEATKCCSTYNECISVKHGDSSRAIDRKWHHMHHKLQTTCHHRTTVYFETASANPHSVITLQCGLPQIFEMTLTGKQMADVDDCTTCQWQTL